MEEKNKKKHSWPLYIFLTIITFLLIMILVVIFYFCSLCYGWASYSLMKNGYMIENEIYDNAISNTTIDSNNTVD